MTFYFKVIYVNNICKLKVYCSGDFHEVSIPRTPVRKQGTSYLPSASLLISMTALKPLKQNSPWQTLLRMSPFASYYTYASISHILLVGGQTLFLPVTGSQLDCFLSHIKWDGDADVWIL